MALDLETIDAHLAQLRQARGIGISSVSIGGDGTIVTAFKPEADMAATEAWLLHQRAALTGTAVTTIRVAASKGLDE